MNAIFVVDEKPASYQFLKEELHAWGDDYEVNHVAPEDVDHEKNGLVFLSADWHQWEKLALRLKATNHAVVVTSYDLRDALKVIDLQLFGFLQQPIDDNQLARLGKRWKKQKHQPMGSTSVALPKLESPIEEEVVYGIQLTDGIVFLKQDQIVRLQADNNYSIIFTKNGQKYVSAKSLKYFESQFEETSFVRVHKSHIVNISEINQYKKDKGVLLLKDGMEVEVSRRKKSVLLDRVKLI
jgi:two-component system LytT family response regulator